MTAFQTLALVAATASSKEKLRLLESCREQDFIKLLLFYCYNPYMTYRVQQLDTPDTYNTIQPNVFEELFQLCDLLAKHATKPNDARKMIKRLMEKCTEENAQIVAKVFQKDLKIGINVSTINKAFPGLVPEFNVQLAMPMEKYDKKKDKMIEFWSTLQYPVILEEKYDGMRIIAVCDGSSVKYYSRDGMEYDTLDFMSDQIMALRPGTSFVLDGEIIGTEYNPNCDPAKKCYDAGKHWEFEQGKSMTKKGNLGKGKPYPVAERRQYLGFYVWDFLELDVFESGGKKGVAKPLRQRKMDLAALFLRFEESPLKNVIHTPSILAFSREEIKDFTDKVIANGGEGSMVKRIDRPYEFDRTDAVLKVKQFKTADLRVYAVEEGEGKYEGMLGAVWVTDDGIEGTPIKSKVGSGFSDDQRMDMYLRHLRGELVGAIFEVQYFEITADDSLRLPTFLRERDDKTECSWN